MNHFIDVGANRGFLASLIVGLWGGNGHGVSPLSVYDTSRLLGLYKNNVNQHGYCKTGLNRAYPLRCKPTKQQHRNCF